MTEEFLYYIWKYRLFDIKCKTAEGQKIEVIKPGESNRDAGPDFINAKIKIGNTLWAGNVEVHLNSSDWYKHSHDNDKAYGNVILHVVYNNDRAVYRSPQSTDHSPRSDNQSHQSSVISNQLKETKADSSAKEIIPTLVMKGRFDEKLFENYKRIIESKNKIPCEKLLGKVDSIVMTGWKEALLIERLERKVKTIEDELIKNGNNWEQTFYQLLARNFGFKLNAEAFEMLAKSTPYESIAKHKDKLFQIEAILFGQAGLLEKDYKDDYANELKKEYKYLQHKLSLKPIPIVSGWKFLRLRPANFPTIRIAQFGYLLSQNDNLFSRVTEAKKISDIEKIFNIKTSEYWETHYIFDRQNKIKSQKLLGKSSINNLIINTVVPFVFLYGIKKDIFAYREKAMKFLEQIPAERNSITEMWASCGVKANNAFDSQALIELRNEYCIKKKCLNCRIGHKILN